MTQSLRLIICAGGTGGHIYPALAVSSLIKKTHPESEILFIGAGKKIEYDSIGQLGYQYARITARGFKRAISIELFISIICLIIGFFESIKIIYKFKPNVVLLMGGYISIPVSFAAKILRVPIIVHEQNVLPGIATKAASKFAFKTAVSFEETVKYLKRKDNVYITGNPVRTEIINAGKESSLKELKIDNSKKIVLIVGGSQGARSINKAVLKMLPLLEGTDIFVIHIAGERDYGWVKEQINGLTPNPSPLGEGKGERPSINYRLYNYLPDMSKVLCAADLIISRAGATILSEISSQGIPAILIPYPYASENHQALNAEVFEKNGAAIVLQDGQLSKLFNLTDALIHDEKRMLDMSLKMKKLFKKNADEKLMELINEAV